MALGCIMETNTMMFTSLLPSFFDMLRFGCILDGIFKSFLHKLNLILIEISHDFHIGIDESLVESLSMVSIREP